MSDPQQTPNQQTPAKGCPECSAEMGPIFLIDRGHGDYHRDTEYAVEEGWFLWRFPTHGKVRAFMCNGCGRILLYGQPYESQ